MCMDEKKKVKSLMRLAVIIFQARISYVTTKFQRGRHTSLRIQMEIYVCDRKQQIVT